MFTIDLTLKNTPMPFSVQRKTAEDAEKTYQEVVIAMRSDSPELLELTCEQQPEKKIAVLANNISAVMISQKSGAAGAGRTPGFAFLSE
ncbi:MAG: hypothetical protein U7123_00545 [Potamolinea sp.]